VGAVTSSLQGAGKPREGVTNNRGMGKRKEIIETSTPEGGEILQGEKGGEFVGGWGNVWKKKWFSQKK